MNKYINELHRIREKHYEMAKNMTNEERRQQEQDAAECFLKAKSERKTCEFVDRPKEFEPVK